MSSSQPRAARLPHMPRVGGGLAILAGGSLLAGAAVAGGVAAASAVSASWGARAADASFVLCIAVPLIACAMAAGRISHDRLSAGRAGPRGIAAWGAFGIAGVTLAAGIAMLAGAPAVRGAAGAGAAIVPGTLLVLLQASGEEVYLRGWFMPALARRWGAAWAIALSALLFALLHILGGARAPLTLLNMALGGVLFGLLARRSGGLGAAIAAHFGWNWGEAFLLGLDPNPGVGSFGAILNVDLAGPRWLGGSDEGLNASAPMTLVLLALLLLAARWRWPAAPGAAADAR